MGFEYCLVDNWWDTQIGRDRIAELSRYAQSKGVYLLLWYNSNGFWNDAPQGPRDCMSTAIAREREMKWMQSIGIKGIKVVGLTDGDPLSDNHSVQADLNNTGMKALYTITSQLDFTYHEDEQNGNYLEYNNLSSTVQEFKLEIPVVVEYIWGEFNTKATVTVKRTENNAKKF